MGQRVSRRGSEPLRAASSSTSMAVRQFRVLYDFVGAGNGELSVKKGEFATAVQATEDGSGWTHVRVSRQGADRANQTADGLVPTAYLRQELTSTPSAPTLRAPPLPPVAPSAPAVSNVAVEHAECTICYGEMFEMPAGTLIGADGKRSCRHFLHYDCATAYASRAQSKTCPICRKPFSAIQKVPDLDRNPRAWFDCVDADGNGRLSKAEVLEVLKALLPVDYSALENNVDKLWSRWDIDGSGEVDFQELCKAGGLLSYVRSHYARKQKLAPPPLSMSSREEFFTYWDEDGNGTLEEEEIVRAVVKTLRLDANKIPMVRDYLRCIWTIVDPDNSGEVDLEEFTGRDGLGEMLIANLSMM